MTLSYQELLKFSIQTILADSCCLHITVCASYVLSGGFITDNIQTFMTQRFRQIFGSWSQNVCWSINQQIVTFVLVNPAPPAHLEYCKHMGQDFKVLPHRNDQSAILF